MNAAPNTIEDMCMDGSLFGFVTEIPEARDISRGVKEFGLLHAGAPNREVSERLLFYIQSVIRCSKYAYLEYYLNSLQIISSSASVESSGTVNDGDNEASLFC
jgi:hypothetical protein